RRVPRVGVVEAAHHDRLVRVCLGVEVDQLRRHSRTAGRRYLLQGRGYLPRVGGDDNRVHVVVEHLHAARRPADRRATGPPRRARSLAVLPVTRAGYRRAAGPGATGPTATLGAAGRATP